jgi:hypothetical protein
MAEVDNARALVSVLGGSSWLGVVLAKAYLKLMEGLDEEAIARQLYSSGSFTLKKARELIPMLKADGFSSLIPKREKTGSAENPITKLFPAAITEQLFLTKVDSLREQRPTVDYEDKRFAGHTLVDFDLKEGQSEVPINVKNAGTRFENAQQLVGINPNDCIPIPAYKAYDAIEKAPNLLYAISVDYSLIETIKTSLVPQFEAEESITWQFLNSYSGSRIRDAEDKFIYGMTMKHWDRLYPMVVASTFCVISARKVIRILQTMPKRTPGIGLRAWGTGASAEVNVHISISQETKAWAEISQRICDNGLDNIVNAINRKRTEVVYDPEI